MRDQHLIIWDGDCGFCQWSVERLRARDRKGILDDVPRQRCSSPPMTPELMARTSQEVVLWTRSGEILGGADAVIEIFAVTGWGGFARAFRLPPMIWILRAGYRWVARNRLLVSRILRLPASCALPSKDGSA